MYIRKVTPNAYSNSSLQKLHYFENIRFAALKQTIKIINLYTQSLKNSNQNIAYYAKFRSFNYRNSQIHKKEFVLHVRFNSEKIVIAFIMFNSTC